MVTPSRLPFVTCIRVVSSLIRADDVVTDEESVFVERLMEDMSFGDEERKAANQPMDLEAGFEELSALSKPMKRILLETLIKASRTDGHIDPRELAFVEQLGHRFGLSNEAIGELWVESAGRPSRREDDPLENLDTSRLQPSDEGEEPS